MEDPIQRLKGDWRAQARYADLVALLSKPQDEAEAELFLMLCRFINDEELATLIYIINRKKGTR